MIAALLNHSACRTWTVLKRFMGMLGILYIHHPTLSFAGTLLVDRPAPYEQCGYCHEYDGNPSMGSYPKLAGQKKSYLLKQLLDYKLGLRDGRGMMETAASMLSDQDMQVVTDFFSKQKRTLDGVTSTGVDYAHAREIYAKGDRMRQIIACKLCHTSSDPRIPYLTGQHAEYVSMQLHAFKNKTRTNDEATIMQFIAERLTDDEIAQLSQYLATGEDQQ